MKAISTLLLVLSVGCSTVTATVSTVVSDVTTLAKRNVSEASQVAEAIVRYHPPCTAFFNGLGGIPEGVEYYVSPYAPDVNYVGWVYRSAPGKVFIQVNFATGASRVMLVRSIIHELAHLSLYAANSNQDPEGVAEAAEVACMSPPPGSP